MFEISISRGYNEQSFREDLKVLYNRLGIENRRICFVFSDQHVVEDGTRPLLLRAAQKYRFAEINTSRFNGFNGHYSRLTWVGRLPTLIFLTNGFGARLFGPGIRFLAQKKNSLDFTICVSTRTLGEEGSSLPFVLTVHPPPLPWVYGNTACRFGTLLRGGRREKM